MAKKFPWKRILGVTKAKRDFARKTGIPTTRSGMQRKLKRGVGCMVVLIIMTAVGLFLFVDWVSDRAHLFGTTPEMRWAGMPKLWRIAQEGDSLFDRGQFRDAAAKYGEAARYAASREVHGEAQMFFIRAADAAQQIPDLALARAYLDEGLLIPGPRRFSIEVFIQGLEEDGNF